MTIHIQTTTIECHNPSFKEWLNVSTEAMRARAHAPWIIGDLLTYGEDAFGEKYAQALDECLVQQHTLENWRWVCRSFPPSRRRESLSWSHHEVVAKFSEDEQNSWLNMAERQRWSVHDFRGAVTGKSDASIVIDDRFAADFQEWMDETLERSALLKDIRRHAVEVVGFDKDKQTPLVKRKSKAA